VEDSQEQFSSFDKPDNEQQDEDGMDSLMAMTVVALKEKLRIAGLPVSGNKADLVDRLILAKK